MKYKDNKDRKVVRGRIVECIEETCTKPANSEGLCWEHLDIENKEQLSKTASKNSGRKGI